MALLRPLIYSGLIFITAIASSVDENPKRSSTAWDTDFDKIVPVHYDVKLISYFKENQEEDEIYVQHKADIEKYQAKSSIVFYGELNVTVNILHPTSKIWLNSSTSMLHLRSFNKQGYSTYGVLTNMDTMFFNLVLNSEYDAATQTCILYFNVELPRGSYILNIKFLNAINNTENIIIPLRDIFRKESGQYEWSDVTHFQAIGARRLFPCWDKPTIKATFNISIKHHRQYEVFSNMPMRKEKISEIYKTVTRTKWTHFEITPAMSTHIVTLVFTPIPALYDIGIYHSIAHIIYNTSHVSHTSNVFMLFRPELYDHMKYAHKVALEIMLQMEIKWRDLQIPAVQFNAINNLLYDKQNWGLVLNRETNIMYDENLDSVAHKINVARLIGREIIYQWFGNLVNPSWSSHLWLIDGLTMLFAMDAINLVEGYKNSEMLDLFIVQVQFDSLRLETLSFMKPLITEVNPIEIDPLSLFPRYIKAPIILRMLQYLITDEVFRESVLLYLKYAFYSTTPDDFWVVMQTTVDASHNDPYIKKYMPSLKTMIYNWTSMDCPVLKVTRDYSKNSTNIRIENYDIFEKNLVWIPVTYTTQTIPNFTKLKYPFYDERLIVMRSNKPSEQVIINEDGWVIFNLQQAGYYRVNYDPDNWQKIAKYLNSKEFTKIHVLNRAKIIDDAFYFMVEHQLDPSIFWKLTNYLIRETNYIAWYPMIKVFEYMSSVFPLPNEGVQIIKNKITRMLDFLLRNINYEEDSKENGLTKCLRQEAIKWACILNDLNCQMVAHDRLLERIQMLKTNKYYRLLPWWEEWIYCKGLMLANNVAIWQDVINISISENKMGRFSEFLTCTSSHVINKSLEIIFKENEYMNEIEINRHINSFFSIVAKHAKHHDVLSNLLKNFYKFKPSDMNSTGIAIFIVIVNNVYSREQLDEIRESMRNIIETEVYKIHFKRVCEKTGCLLHDTVIEANLRRYKDFVQQWMLYAEYKLQMRLSQIKEQISYLQTFLE